MSHTIAFPRLAWLALAAGLLIALPGCGNKAAPAAPAPAEGAANAPTSRGEGGVAADKPAAEAAVPAAPVVPKHILLWHAYRDAERGALDTLVKTWNDKHPEIQIEALAIPYDAMIDKTQVAIPRGNGPDLIIMAHDKIGTWARDGLIGPLGDFATPDRLRRFLPATVKPLVFERSVYGLPLAFKSTVLFYNRKLVPKPPTTLAELTAMAKPLVNAEDGKFGLAYDASDLYYHAAFLHAYGGTVLDEQSRALTIDSAEAAAAIDAVRKLHSDGVLPKGMTGFIVTAMFNDAKVPFVINGPWFLSEIDKAVDFGVATLPLADNGKPLMPYLGSEAILLSAKTKERDAALTVLDYLTSDEAALTRLQQGKQMVANAKIYENPEWGGDPIIKIFRAQAEVAVPMSNSVEAGVAWAPYSNALRRSIFGEQSSKDALAQAAKDAAGALEKLRK